MNMYKQLDKQLDDQKKYGYLVKLMKHILEKKNIFVEAKPGGARTEVFPTAMHVSIDVVHVYFVKSRLEFERGGYFHKERKLPASQCFTDVRG